MCILSPYRFIFPGFLVSPREDTPPILSNTTFDYNSRLDSGIKTLADIRGKRCAIDIASAVTNKQTKVFLRAGGLDPDKDVKLVPVAGIVEPLVAFVEGRVAVTQSAIGHPKVKEAAAKLGGVYWVPVCRSKDDAATNYIRKELPGMDVKFWKAGRGPDIKNDTWTYDYPYHVLTYRDFSEKAVYQIAKAIYENEKELAAIHRKFKGWSKAMIYEGVVIPYHPGAVRFYKEKGLWNDKMEQVQQKLLSQ